jgi:hypothetical protein
MSAFISRAALVLSFMLIGMTAGAVDKIKVQLIGTGQKGLTPADVSRITACKLVFHLKPGMTNAEANDAIDAGYQKWFDCLKHPGRL